MADEDIAFQLMRLYRTLRGPGDARVKDAARREIDLLMRELEANRSRLAAALTDGERPRLRS